MDRKSNPLANLASQVRRGEGEQRFWQEMGPQLQRMVRRVVRFGPGHSVLDQKIDREVNQVTAGFDQDAVVDVVARRLFDEMVDRLRTGGPGRLQETMEVPAQRDFPTRLERAPAFACV